MFEAMEVDSTETYGNERKEAFKNLSSSFFTKEKMNLGTICLMGDKRQKRNQNKINVLRFRSFCII